MTEQAELLDDHDIQGLVVRGFGSLPAARFLVFAVEQPERARHYLQGLCKRINVASDRPRDGFAIQVAFTAPGLERLGVPASALATFSRELLEGMDEEVRADALGDRGDNASSQWLWGRRGEPIHVLLMLYARDEAGLEDLRAKELDAVGDGLRLVHERTTTSLPDQKEHFGFRDGLSMPKIAGVPDRAGRGREKRKREWWTDPIPAGELVLGYRNDYGAFTESPIVLAADDPHNHLPAIDDTHRSLGRNGTYLVFREMQQDVHAFWRYLAASSREPGGDPVARAIALGAKMVGRWPGGAPLMTSPDRDDPERATDNRFLYRHDQDRVGLRCPPGAHIRRANPRDALAPEDRGEEASILMVRKHQMIRRGRPFGPPVSATMDPREILRATPDASPDDQPRGLHFICLVGDINRQFEFVQRAWIDSANFDSMFKDGDPIAAARRRSGESANPNDEFTCPAVPVRRKYKAMPPFTRLVGGGYFFLPGLAALRFIARHP